MFLTKKDAIKTKTWAPVFCLGMCTWPAVQGGTLMRCPELSLRPPEKFQPVLCWGPWRQSGALYQCPHTPYKVPRCPLDSEPLLDQAGKAVSFEGTLVRWVESTESYYWSCLLKCPPFSWKSSESATCVSSYSESRQEDFLSSVQGQLIKTLSLFFKKGEGSLVTCCECHLSCSLEVARFQQ